SLHRRTPKYGKSRNWRVHVVRRRMPGPGRSAHDGDSPACKGSNSGVTLQLAAGALPGAHATGESGLVALLHAAAPGVHGSLGAVADVEFAKYVADVGLHRLLADAEALGDHLVAQSLGNQGQRFALALAQRTQDIAAGFDAAAHGIHQA